MGGGESWQDHTHRPLVCASVRTINMPLRLVATLRHMVGQLTIMVGGVRGRTHGWTTTVGTGAI